MYKKLPRKQLAHWTGAIVFCHSTETSAQLVDVQVLYDVVVASMQAGFTGDHMPESQYAHKAVKDKLGSSLWVSEINCSQLIPGPNVTNLEIRMLTYNFPYGDSHGMEVPLCT